MQTIVMYLAFAGLALCAPAFVVRWLRERGIDPLRELTVRFRRLPVLSRIVLGVILVNLFVYGSTKTNNVPPLAGLFAPPSAAGPENDTVNGFTREQLDRGFVMSHTGTNETWDFSMSADAEEVQAWRMRGAADDWYKPTNGIFNLIFADGRLQDRLRDPTAVYAPLSAGLGIVPEANWGLVAGSNAVSRVWYRKTAWNSVVVTWQDVLFGRETNSPCSVQAEFYEDGNFTYRYDLSRIPEGAALSNVTVVAATERGTWESGIGKNCSSMSFHALDARDGTEADRDGDGLSTYDEIFNTLTDPGNPDSDGDGLSDGEEVAAGTDPLAVSVPNARLLERIEDFSTNALFGTSTSVVTNELVGLKLWDAFVAEWPSGRTNLIYERTIRVNRESNWQQYYLSSRPDGAGGWSLEGMTLEWCDSEGESGRAAASPIGDSFYLPLSTNNPQSVTIRLFATAPHVRSRLPVHLLCYAPAFRIEGGQEVTMPDGERVTVFTEGSDSSIGLEIDRSKRPCKAGLYPGEKSLDGISDMCAASGGLFEYEGTSGGGTIRASGAGVMQLPSIAVKNVQSGSRRLLKGSSGNEGRSIVVLSPCVWYGEHACGTWSARMGAERPYVEYYYPIDSGCLWRDWQCDDWGGWACDCRPAASCGLGDRNGYARVETVVDGETVTATAYVGDTAVWTGSATHYWAYGCGGPGIERLDGCESCANSCKNGKCDAWEGPSLQSLKFRIPVGNPRGSQVSGFAYFDTEGPLPISPEVFKFIFRRGADVTVTTNGLQRTVSCRDNRGRELVIDPIANGVRVTINVQATGALEHSWEIVNVGGDDRRVRLRQISRLNNTMQDWLYEHVQADADDDTSWHWQATDIVAGVREEVEKEDRLAEDGRLVERRTKYDGEGNWLGSVERVSELVGEGDSLSLCETYREEQTCVDIHVRQADYWRDPEHPARNGKLRLLTATDAPWQYHEWDSDGRETICLEQRNGSDVPTSFPLVTSNGVEGVTGVADATLTVYDYAPLPGDAENTADFGRVRTESRYVIRRDAVTLVGRTWHVYTHGTSSGYPTVRDERWRASSPEAQFGDSSNVHSYEETVDSAGACEMPIVLRGLPVARLDESGLLTVCEPSVASGVVSIVSHVSFGTCEAPTYEVRELDASYGNVLRQATLLTANDVVVEEERSVYDDQNRLRATQYLDGTSLTNAYSCCRKLWSRDREGRRTLRSAVTGEDKLYFADEEVWLREVSTNGQHKVTQHFVDAFGRETNTVVCVAEDEGEATDRAASDGRRLYEETASFAGLTSDQADTCDRRGKRMTMRESQFEDRVEKHQETFAGDAAVGDRVNATTIEVRNGSRTELRSWDGKWTERVEWSDYDANGCRFDVRTTESSDYGLVTNSVLRYDFSGRLVSRETPEGVTTCSYDGASRQVSEEAFAAGGVDRVTTYVYSAWGEEIGTVCDGTVSETQVSYEQRSGDWWRVTRDAEYAGQATNWCFESAVQVTGLSDALCAHKVTVDANGVRTETCSSRDPATGIRTETETSSVRAPRVRTSKCGLPLTETTEEGTTTYSYDALGRCVCQSRGLSRGEFVYSPCGDLVETRLQTNETSFAVGSAAYDSQGRCTSVTDFGGATVFVAYDGAGNVVSVSGATPAKRFGYDTQGRRTLLATTRDGTTWDETRWTYDGATGRCLSKTYPDGSAETYVHTPDGLQAGVIRPGNVWEERRYDARRHLVSVGTSDGTVVHESDAFGRQIASSNDIAVWRADLDCRGTATNECVAIGTNAFRVVRTVDGAGRVRAVNGRRISYDEAGRIAAVATDEAVATYRYDADGQETGWTLALAGGATFVRDVGRDPFVRSRIVSVTNRCGAAVLGAFDYAHDACGRVVRRNADRFAYDACGQVSEATVWTGAGSNAVAYAYDGAGNWQDGLANRLNEYAVIGGTGTAYSANGELLSAGDRTFAYDACGRLASVAVGGTPVLVNRYDPEGRRVQSVDAAGTHTFVYDGWCPILETLERADGSSETVEYVWGRDLSGSLQGAGGAGGLLYMKRNGAVYVPLYDANGNVCAYADSAGAIAVAFAYDAFGNDLAEHADGEADAFRFRYSTKWYEEAAGLYGYGKRFYSPECGRWLSRDPLGEASDANLYRFCENAPTWLYDAFGELTKQECDDHYRDKTGTPLSLPFSEIDTSSVRPEDFPAVQVYLAVCGKGTHAIRYQSQSDNHPFSTTGGIATVLGDVTLKLEGTLEIRPSGDWTFDGTLKCFDDEYDFRMDYRIPRDIQTLLGRPWGSGESFWINIHGSKHLTGSGNCCDFRKTSAWWL